MMHHFAPAALSIAVKGVSTGFSSNYDDLLGETVRLECSSNSCLVGAKLEWLDGRVPIRNDSLANLELVRSVSSYDTLTLHIHNFSVENYGQYRCRCVKDLRSSHLLSGESIVHNNLEVLAESGRNNMFCSDQDHSVVTLVPSEQESASEAIEERLVATPGDPPRQLSCDSGNWIIWRANSEPKRFITDGESTVYNVSVVKSTDQSKVVCLNQDNTLQKIFYVSIKDYQQLPLEFINPLNEGESSVVNFDSTAWPIPWPVLCALVKPSQSQTANLTYSVLNGTNEFTIEGDAWPPVLYKRNYLEWFSIQLFGTPIQHLQALFNPNVTISCTAESVWEPKVSTTLRAVRPGMESTRA